MLYGKRRRKVFFWGKDSMFLHIIEAKHISDYKVEVVFNDGKKGIADLSDALNGDIFEPLKDKSVFAQLKIDKELETISWANGADIAPEYVYFQAFKNHPEFQELFKKWGYVDKLDRTEEATEALEAKRHLYG